MRERHGATRRLLSRLLAFVVLSVALLSTVPAFAAGPDAILTPAGYNTNSITRADDTANMVVGLPFSMNWNGTTYSQVYINMNGNVTFGQGYTAYNPTTALASTGQNIMAPFWADVDTRNTSMGAVTYSNITPGNVPTVDGRPAFFVNWVDVGRYNYTSGQATTTNSFQLVLIDRSDTGAGNFDFMFNYDEITWDIATASSSQRARVGWGRSDGTGYELPGSGTAQGSTSALLDTSAAATSLIQNSLNDDGQLGRYVWQVRNGGAPNVAPIITVVDRVLEGNAPDAYLGYLGTGDATAVDPENAFDVLVSNRPTVLPRGDNSVLWTATDTSGYMGQQTQSIVVTDTTPPSTLALSSATHTPGVWRTVPTVSFASSLTSDTCAGVTGISYAWTRGAAADPDTTPEPSTPSSASSLRAFPVDDEPFASADWPQDWQRVLVTGAGAPATYVRSQNTRAVSGYAGEIYASNTTRRTFGFQRDFDLSGLDSATLSFSQYTTQLDNGGADYSRVEYSVNGGANWTQLINTTTNIAWTARSYGLPVGGTVRVRFSGSVNATNEFVDFDNIAVNATKTVSVVSRSMAGSTSLADGSWYLTARAVDAAGNWTPTASYGPVLVDANPPVTTTNVPVGWSSTVPFSVSLTATDAGSLVGTRYSVNAGAEATYTAPFSVSTQGTSTIRYWSYDAAGNREATRTATLRLDSGAPSQPGAGGASAASTASVEVTWTASTDTVSGVSYYRILRDGSQIATTTALTFTDAGLNAGQAYSYSVIAVDAAGNPSAARTYSVTIPTSEISLTLSTSNVNMGALDPATTLSSPAALTATVGGVGMVNYDLSCSGQDFSNATTGSPTPTMPIGSLQYATSGAVSLPARSFTATPTLIHTGGGGPAPWMQSYVFGYSLNVPWSYEPGTYTTVITYTVVMK